MGDRLGTPRVTRSKGQFSILKTSEKAITQNVYPLFLATALIKELATLYMQSRGLDFARESVLSLRFGQGWRAVKNRGCRASRSPKPYKFIGGGAMEVTNPINLQGLGPWRSPNPVKF